MGVRHPTSELPSRCNLSPLIPHGSLSGGDGGAHGGRSRATRRHYARRWRRGRRSAGDRARRTGGWPGADAGWSDRAETASDGDAGHSPWHRSGEAALRGWTESAARYDDLIRPAHEIHRPVNGVGHGHHAGDAAPVAVRAPASAPPYPYEGDLEDAIRDQRPAIPAARPGPSTGHPDPEAPADPDPGEQARHAIEEPTPSGGLPAVPRWRSADRGAPREGADEPATPDAASGSPATRHDRAGGRPSPRYGDRPQPRDPDAVDRYTGPRRERPRDRDESGEPEAAQPGFDRPEAAQPGFDRPDDAGPGVDRSDHAGSGGHVDPPGRGGPDGYPRRRGPAPRLFGPAPGEGPDRRTDDRPAFGRRAEAEAADRWADSPAASGRWSADPAAAGRRSGDSTTGHESTGPDAFQTGTPDIQAAGRRVGEASPPGGPVDSAGSAPWPADPDASVSRRSGAEAPARWRAESEPATSRRADAPTSGPPDPETPVSWRAGSDAPGPRRGGSGTPAVRRGFDDPDDRQARAEWAPTWPETWRPGADHSPRPDAGRAAGAPVEPAGTPGDQAPAEQSDRGVPRPWSAGWPGRGAARSDYDPPAYRPGSRAGYEPPRENPNPGPGDRFPAPTEPAPPRQPVTGAPPEPVAPTRATDPATAVLPQRVPAEPDVPTVPEQQAVEPPPAETPELARIATHLRREDGPPTSHEPPEEFDVDAIVAAVSEVSGVRDASLRTTPAGAHSLRLDLHDGADPAEVSRLVARLLQDRMGLAAAPPSALPPAPAEPAPVAPPVPPAAEVGPDVPRRRRQPAPHRGRATVEEPARVPRFPEPGTAAGVIGTVAGHPVAAVGRGTVDPTTAGVSYQGGQITTTESAPSRPLNPGANPGPRVVIDHVQVSTFGLDATVEVRLAAGPKQAAGVATGPAVDGYVLRLCAVSAALAIDELLLTSQQVTGRGRCFVEHAAMVPFGSSEVAVVVVLLVCGGWVEQLAGSALVSGDPRQAVVRATLAAVNRRLEALLSDGQ
ncbi:hypothetical protein [Polymorphospora rubra]|nr:hypothetical protein [Polymorphospora rubra]